MACLPIKPLDGAGSYLRWKESLLLRVHTLGVAYVLSEAPPAGGGHDAAAAKKWARNDAVCRGHILRTLSDRLLPDYARFATAAELWRALARTYDVEPSNWISRFYEFCFDRSTGDVLLEQIAHAETLGAAAGLRDDDVAFELRRKIPFGMSLTVTGGGKKALESIWEVARRFVSDGMDPWYEYRDDDDDDYDGPKPEQNTSSRKRHHV